MLKAILPYVVTLIVYVVGETLWLKSMSKNYAKWLGAYNPSLKVQSLAAAALAYVVLLGTFAFLVLARDTRSSLEAILLGGAFGLAVYMTYNCTNKATLPGYRWSMVLYDTLWGAVWFAFLALVFYHVRKMWGSKA